MSLIIITAIILFGVLFVLLGFVEWVGWRERVLLSETFERRKREEAGNGEGRETRK